MPQPVSIQPGNFAHKGMDFHFLREEGIRHLQRLSGEIWTDHNVHDPGITILDQLCFALTDLSYRLSYDMEDLLATENGNPYAELYSPAKILTSNPVTLGDLRKIVLDVEGVRNAWVEKVSHTSPEVYFDREKQVLTLNSDGNGELVKLKGLYKVMFELEDQLSEPADAVTNRVRQSLMQCRNLGEDFSEIKPLDRQAIRLNATIEIGKVDDPHRLTALIYDRLSTFFSPGIRFYSLQEMLAKGLAIEEIFDGPRLQQGFIDNEELAKLKKREAIRASDLIQELMDLEGVLAVIKISLQTGSGLPEDWVLKVDPNKTPQLDIEKSSISFIRNDLQVSIDPEEARRQFYDLRAARPATQFQDWQKDIQLEARRPRDISSYYSFQNHLQPAFGVGESGLPDLAGPERIGQARQLKGYLSFFDQIIANYFAQTAHLKDLFSFENTEGQTYWSQNVLASTPELSEVLNPDYAIVGFGPGTQSGLLSCTSPEHGLEVGEEIEIGGDDNYAGKYRVKQSGPNSFAIEVQHVPGPENQSGWWRRTDEQWDRNLRSVSEQGPEAAERKNRLLNHLMARFSEQFTDYSLLLYELDKESQASSARLLRDKQRFLKDYPEISALRSRALNYSLPTWGTFNVSGLERRISRLMGIERVDRRFLADEYMALRKEAQKDFSFAQADFVTLLDRGLWPKSYQFDSQTGKVSLMDKEGNGLAESKTILTSAEVEAFIAEQIAAWKSRNTRMEGMHLVEHILLRPRSEDLNHNTDLLTFSHPITKVELGSAADRLLCHSKDHDLLEGEGIEIFGTAHLNENYTVWVLGPDSFEIEVKDIPQDLSLETGSWVRTRQRRDPWSLQVTFTLPTWPARFRNPNFRRLLEKTIRAETPAHLNLFLQWLDVDEMQEFEESYSAFFDQLRKY